MINIETKQILCFRGTTEPCAYGTLTSVVGGISEAENAVNGPRIQDFLEQHFGIPKNR